MCAEAEIIYIEAEVQKRINSTTNIITKLNKQVTQKLLLYSSFMKAATGNSKFETSSFTEFCTMKL
jgi:hypothetical protein